MSKNIKAVEHKLYAATTPKKGQNYFTCSAVTGPITAARQQEARRDKMQGHPRPPGKKQK